MSEELTKEVAGLSAQVKFMIDILKDIQKELRYNHMPLAQIEEKFKNQGERIGNVELEQKAILAETRKQLDDIVNEMETKFAELAKENERIADRKRESPYKIIAAIAALVATIGLIASGVAWIMYHIK